MTFSTLLPYLLVAGGYLLRHYNVVGTAAGLLGHLAGPNPFAAPSAPAATPAAPAPAAPALPTLPIAANHPVLSEAVNAAIQAAVQAAMADLKAKV